VSLSLAIQPIRILKLVPTLLCGGTENQCMTLSRALNAERFHVELACLRRVGPFVTQAAEVGLALHEYPIGSFRSGRALAPQARFASDVARRHFDIVHAYNFYGNVFAVPPARLAARPVVIASIRDCGPYLTPMQMRVQRHVCRWATRILVNAEAVKQWLVEQGYNRSRIAVIPNGVDLDRFSTKVDPVTIRYELGLPSGVDLVTVVSRLNQLKGLEQFLEAAAMLVPRFPKAFFLIVGESRLGDTEYQAALTRLADRLGIAGRVRFTGIRNDVPAVLASSTVSVMPSLNEALSNVLLESMAAGAPTVATRVGGTPEAMVDGVTGLLVEPGDVNALANAIGRLLGDPSLAIALATAARQTIADRYSVDRMARATEQLYVELLAEKRLRRVESVWSIKTSSRQLR
jgi:glycosyltransferase involved in cell wall biosynthesis